MYVIDVAKVVLFFEMSKFFPIFSDAEARRNVALTLTAPTLIVSLTYGLARRSAFWWKYSILNALFSSF